MKLRSIIKKAAYAWQLHKFRKLVTMTGTHYTIGPSGSVSFADGSSQSDIILDDHVFVFGSLMSQSHGKITIGDHSRVGRGVMIQSVESITIGRGVTIARDVVVTDNNTHPTSLYFKQARALAPLNSPMHLWKWSAHKPVSIGDFTWVGERSRICKGVSIGKNCVIAAHSVVTKDVPDNCIAAGNPAKIVKTNIEEMPEPESCKEFEIYMKENGTRL